MITSIPSGSAGQWTRRRLFGRAAAFLAITGVLVGLFVGIAPPVAGDASAVQTASAPAVVAPSPTPVAGDPRQPPTITSPPDGTFIGRSSTTISGTRAPDQEIQLLSPSGGDPLCIREANGTTTWSCPVHLTSSPAVTLRVVDSTDASLASAIRVQVLTPPVVTGGPTGLRASNGIVRGTAYPGASVTAKLSTGAWCTSTADTSGAWSCLFEHITTSGGYAVTASQISGFSAPSSSNDSAPMTLVFDVDAPAAPTLVTPAAHTRVSLDDVVYAGAGEVGATVTVFADAYSVCTARVGANGAWTCTADVVPAGTFLVRVIQQDEAGNVGPGSRPAVVTFGQGQAAPPRPVATGGPQAVPAPAAPVPAAPPAPAPAATPTPDVTATPAPAAPGLPPAAPQAAPPRAPEFQGPTGPVSGGWNDPTRFAVAVSPPGTAELAPWLQAVLLALAAIGLLAVPARLLAGTISRSRAGRPGWGARQLSGRNHARVEFETAPDVRVNRRLVSGAALVAAAALVMLSGPITDRPAYLRLLAAVLVSLVLLNAVATLVPLWWGRRLLGVTTSVTFLPRYLLLVAVAALGSRSLDVHPALLFGLLGSVSIPLGTSAAVRGQLAAVRAGSLLIVALLGWLLLGALPPASGFTRALAAEVTNSLVLLAIGSAVLVLLPVGRTSGRSILAWSPWAWGALTLTAFVVLFGVLEPTFGAVDRAGGPALLWVTATAFAAVSVSAWAWQRFVSPTLS